MCSVSQGSKKVTFGAWRPQEGLVRRMLALASSNFPPCRCGNFYLRKFFLILSASFHTWRCITCDVKLERQQLLTSKVSDTDTLQSFLILSTSFHTWRCITCDVKLERQQLLTSKVSDTDSCANPAVLHPKFPVAGGNNTIWFWISRPSFMSHSLFCLCRDAL